jgi:glycerol-3-phosphate dehydrogenase
MIFWQAPLFFLNQNFFKEKLNFLSKEYQYGYQYADLQIDDSRLTLLNILDSEQYGAEVYNYTKVISVSKIDDIWEINLSNGKTVFSKILVNATGPMIGSSLKDVFKSEVSNTIRLIQGSHIIIDKLYDEDKAYILQQPDKRIVFIIPYLEKYSLIGTTEVEVNSAINPCITSEEKNYLIESINRFSAKKIKEQDILWSYSGVRPLIQDSTASMSKNSRDYHLDVQLDLEKLIHIYGGKLTTYRKLSEKTVDHIDSFFQKKHHRWTGEKKLPGSENNLKSHLKYPIDEATINRITKNYGGLSVKVFECMDDLKGVGFKIFENLYEFEILYLLKYEHAKNADDILFRRTKLGIQFNSEEIRNKINSVIKDHLN